MLLINGTERMYLKVISKLLYICVCVCVCVCMYVLLKIVNGKPGESREKRKRNVKKLSLIILKPNKILSLSFTKSI